MGRGRAKAKQTKVARQLKYSSPNTNFDELQRELGGTGDTADAIPEQWVDEGDWDSPSRAAGR